MTPTIHQRVALWLWHWPNIADEQLLELYLAGARVLCVQLQDDGPVPKWKVDAWKKIAGPKRGFSVWGVVRPRNEPLHDGVWTPAEVVSFAAREKNRLGLNGMRFNIEDEGRQADIDSHGAWSEEVGKGWRIQFPKLSSCLDTYFGAAAGGMNLGAYVSRGFRMNVQTYWGAEGIYDDPVPRVVNWCAGAQPSIPKANVKPGARVTKNNSGDYLNAPQFLTDCKRSGTIGLYLYYIDGALDRQAWLEDLIRNAIAMGVAY